MFLNINIPVLIWIWSCPPLFHIIDDHNFTMQWERGISDYRRKDYRSRKQILFLGCTASIHLWCTLTYSLSLEDIMIFDPLEIHFKIIMQYPYCVPNKERHKNIFSQIQIYQDFSASQPDSYFGCMSWNQNNIIKVWIMLEEWEFEHGLTV
jgi:hypothetical protein